MSFKENLGQLTGKFLNSCKNNNGMFLFGAMAMAWSLASLAQTVGLIANRKITKDEKKFLVPQEILDGTFNIATYAAVTLPLIKGAEMLTKSRIAKNAKVVEGAKTIAAIAGGIISSNIITPLLRNKTSVLIKNKMNEKNISQNAQTIYTNRSYPYFKAKNKPLSMQNYLNLTKTYQNNGSLKI